MHKDGHRDLTRRDLFKTGSAAALGGVVASVVNSPAIRADDDHQFDAEFEIDVGEFYFQLTHREGAEVEAEQNADIHIPAGEHLIAFRNVGAVQHEIHFGHDVQFAGDGDAVGFGTNMWGNFLGLHLNPGETGMLHFNFDHDEFGGEWHVACFIPGHYEAGQTARLIIEEEEEGHHDEEEDHGDE